MKPLLFKIHANRAPGDRRVTTDDNLGRGMDIALTIAVFLGLGFLLDRWLGAFPLFTIVLVLLAATGTFIRLRYTYEAAMQQLDEERRRQSQAGRRDSNASGEAA